MVLVLRVMRRAKEVPMRPKSVARLRMLGEAGACSDMFSREMQERNSPWLAIGVRFELSCELRRLGDPLSLDRVSERSESGRRPTTVVLIHCQELRRT